MLNTLREEGRVVKVARGRYALVDSAEARNGGWSLARKRILKYNEGHGREQRKDC